MDQQSDKKDWLFLLACFGLGVLAEWSFFHGTIGVSYLVFITAFYFVFFQRFRFPFEHRRIGLLLMISIWLMAGSYLFYDATVFYDFNLIVIPLLIFFQLILLKSPAKINWSKLSFIRLVTGKFSDMVKYLADFIRVTMRRLLHRKEKRSTLRRIIVGLFFSIPILAIVVTLLSDKAERFPASLLDIRVYSAEVNILEIILRFGIALIIALGLFSFFQVVGRRTKWDIQIREATRRSPWDALVALTILILLNTVYALFIAYEVHYMLQGHLEREVLATNSSFSHLIMAAMFNLTLLIVFLKRVTTERVQLNIMLKSLYSLFIILSGGLLIIALSRVSMYESVFGFTVTRLFAYIVILYLLVIFAYTFIRVWLEHLSILHFYLITGLLFYMMLQIVNIEGHVVEQNLVRYQATGDVDIAYMSQLGAEGVKGLIALSESEPENKQIQTYLQKKKAMYLSESGNWQGFNFAREEVKELLAEMKLDANEEVE